MTATKTVYPYDADGAPLPAVTLDDSDLCPVALAEGREEWLVPGSCLPTAAPTAQEGHEVKAVNGRWAQVPIVVEHEPEPTVPEPAVPTVCTPAQGLVALYALKQITVLDVEAAIASIQDPVQRYTAQIGYSRATEWRRDSQTMQAMAALLALTEQDMDEIYAYALGVLI